MWRGVLASCVRQQYSKLMTSTDPFDDFDDPSEWDDDDAAELISCPHCGAEIYEESEQCPHCGDYIIAGTSPLAGRPLWWIALGLLGVVATVAVLMAI